MLLKILRNFIYLLFHVLFLFVPLVFTSVNEELFEFNKILCVYVIAIGMFFCWAAICILEKKLVWKRTPLDLPIALFVASQILSTVFSINFHTSIFGYYTRFNGGLLSVFAYAFFYYMFVIFVPKVRLKYFLISLLTGGAFAALFAFPEHFGTSFSCVMFTGKWDVACWVQDVKTRVFGTFGQPNWLAAYLCMLIPVAIANLVAQHHTKKLLDDERFNQSLAFLLRACLLFLFLAVLLFTGSRSGLGAIFVSLLMLAIATLSILRKKFYLILLTFLGFSVLVLTINNPIKERLLKLLPQKPVIAVTDAPKNTPVTGTQLEVGGSESGAIRNVVWAGAIQVWKRYPIFGSGVETFAYSYYRDRLSAHNLLSEWDFLYNKAHNEFLNYLATTGIVGFGTYILLLCSFIIFPLIRVIDTKQPPDERLWLLVFASSLIALTISNFFGFSTVYVSALFFLFPAFCVVLTTKPMPETIIDEVEIKIATSDLAALGIVAVFSFLPLLYFYHLWRADVLYARGKQLDLLNQFTAAAPLLKEATTLMPDEPVFLDEYATNLSMLTVLAAKSGDSKQANALATTAIQATDQVILENNVHTNFWKTRIKVFLTLGSIDPKFYEAAQSALQSARALSPTDPKLVYYLALLAEASKDDKQYLLLLDEAIALKSNYEDARFARAKLYERIKQPQKAQADYEYMLKFINPNNTLAQERLASISATKK